MKQKFLDFGMSVAEATAKMSVSRELQVGAVIMRDNRIIAHGYNGTGAGEDNCCEDECGHYIDTNTPKYETRKNVRHAEFNAIMDYLKRHGQLDGCELITTISPCFRCALIIMDSGIEAVYYRHDFKDLYGVHYLRSNGIPVTKV